MKTNDILTNKSASSAAYKNASSNISGILFQTKYTQTPDQEKHNETPVNADIQNIYKNENAVSSPISEKLNTSLSSQQALEHLKETDYDQYMEEMLKRDLAQCHSIERLMEITAKYQLPSLSFNGITFDEDKLKKTLSIGNMDNGEDIIHVRGLSCGYNLDINQENVGDISKVLDLFTPKDINKIMQAIAENNMINKTKTDSETEAEDLLSSQNTEE